MGPRVVERHVAWAIHGLESVTCLAVDHRGEHRLPVMLQVSRLRKQGLVDQVPRPYVLVAVARLNLAHVIFHEVPDHFPFGQEERNAGSRIGREREQIEILADLAVVPGFRLLQPPEVGIELLLRRPRRTVDAGEHRVLLVAPPVGPRYVLQLESAEPARTGDVRAAAKIEEISLFVDRDLTVFQALDYLRFVGVVYVEVLSFGLGDLLPLYREVPGDDLAHPLFYAWQIPSVSCPATSMS